MLAQPVPALRPTPSAEVIAYAPVGNADVATIFAYSKIKLRLCLHVILSGAAALITAILLTRSIDQSVMTPTVFAMIAGLALFAGMAARIAVEPLLAESVRYPLNTLLLVDGQRPRVLAGAAVLDAPAYQLKPVAANAVWLNRIGHLLKHCDRVVIEATPERRALWLDALQGIDVEIEAPDQDVLAVRKGGLSLQARAAKRMFDLGLTLLTLPLVLPMLAIIALLIKLESPGPVLFRQWRVGLCNRQFEILKFRTMRHGAIDLLGHQSARPEDGRVTRVGRFLRQTSLDELPQLFNVLMGTMSLIGPRPHPIGCRAEGMLHWDIDPAYPRRHAVKPGLTGLAQVRGFRGATHRTSDLTNRLAADLEYIANWSLKSDLNILFRTFGVVVHPNAY